MSHKLNYNNFKTEKMNFYEKKHKMRGGKLNLFQGMLRRDKKNINKFYTIVKINALFTKTPQDFNPERDLHPNLSFQSALLLSYLGL